MGKTLEECHKILGVNYGATEDEIKSAYRKKALQCHPDKNPDDPLSTQKFQELGHAYRQLTGDEDDDSDDDYKDYDMDLWKKMSSSKEFVASAADVSREEEDDDDDFLASLVKEQDEDFTEEEMAQFTSFANLKEQREANKKKFCDRNLSNGKIKQKGVKGNQPKLKNNKQLKAEQWKREKEISEIAVQTKGVNQTLQQKHKAFSRDSKTKTPTQHRSFDHLGNVYFGQEKNVKERSDSACNKRNARKKKNRKKSSSRHQDDKETSSKSTTTVPEQKFVPNVFRNVTIKPETTRRQDELTGRLPCYTSQRSVSGKQTGRVWCEYPKFGPAPSRPSSVTNVWQKRQEKQMLLAELQPSDQNDEELQLQMALELSKKQAEIDEQQREITLLERQMEETLQLEKKLKCQSSKVEIQAKQATVMGHDSFPPLVGHVDDEWVLPSSGENKGEGNEQEKKDSRKFARNKGDDDNDSSTETLERCHKSKPESKMEHLRKGSVEANGVNDRTMFLGKSHFQSPQLCRRHDSETNSCPYGKNCCLGKHCKYLHPSSIDNRKRSKSGEFNLGSQDQCDSKVIDRDNRSEPSSLTGKQMQLVASCEGVDRESEPCCGLQNYGKSDDVFIQSTGFYTTQKSRYVGETDNPNTALREEHNQCDIGTSEFESINQCSRFDIPVSKSKTLLNNRFSLCEGTTENNSNADQPGLWNKKYAPTGNPQKDAKCGSILFKKSSSGATSSAAITVTAPTVYVVADSQFPFGAPAGKGLHQAALGLRSNANLSSEQKPQNSPGAFNQSSSSVNNSERQITAATTTKVMTQSRKETSAGPGSGPGPGVSLLQTASVSSEILPSPRCSSSTSLQTPAAIQTTTTNIFPVFPGFPFLPFASVYPCINPANAAASASLMAGSTDEISFPVTSGTSSQHEGSFVSNQVILRAHLKAGLSGGLSPLGQVLPTQNAPSIMAAQGRSELVPNLAQLSEPDDLSELQSPTSMLLKPFNVPFPLINPLSFVNISTGMALGTPCSVLQNGCQTSSTSVLTAPSQVQGNDKTRKQSELEQKGTGVNTPTKVKRDFGKEDDASAGFGGKTKMLRRPITIPMVMQQQASK